MSEWVNQCRSREDLRLSGQGINDAILGGYGIRGRDYFHVLAEQSGGQFRRPVGLDNEVKKYVSTNL